MTRLGGPGQAAVGKHTISLRFGEPAIVVLREPRARRHDDMAGVSAADARVRTRSTGDTYSVARKMAKF